MSDVVVQTERLQIRRFSLADAAFIFELVNQPSFVEFIGDKDVKTLGDAQRYLEDGALNSYREHGFGPYLVAEADGAAPVGMCGLFKRDDLQIADLGFAFLDRYCKQGYAAEASLGIMRYAYEVLGLEELAAIVDPGNQRSIMLLDRLGFTFKTMYLMPDEDQFLRFYVCDLPIAGSAATST
jgi:RimJ/RimL family protein N-acetyltransferase